MKALQAEIKAAYAEMEARAEAERFLVSLDGLTSYGEGTTTCQTDTTSSSEEMEATKLEATPEETEDTVERQELFKEEINVDNIGSSEDRCEEQRLVVRRRLGAKKRSQDSVGSRQKVSAARKRIIRCAVPAVRTGNIHMGPGKDGSAKGAPKGRRLQKTHRNSPECNIGNRNRGPKDQLRLRMKRTYQRIIKRTSELTSLFDLFIAIREVNENTFWKVRPPPKHKKDVLTA
jgi:hypothetical protein